MNIYVDNGGTVKIYPVRPEVAKAVMTLLEADGELVWSETHSGYGVKIVDKEGSEIEKMKRETAKREIGSLDFYLQNHTNDYSEESHMAMMMAIDALNSSENLNNVLGKIREEIKHYKRKTQLIDPYDLVGDCLDIIDKYKIESEK